MERALFNESDPLLTKEEELWLEDHGQTLHRAAGHIFMEQGETTDFVLLIRKGHVKVMAGAPKRIIAIRSAGDIVGGMSAIRGKPHSATIEAVDVVEVLRVSASQWVTFLEAHPRAAIAQIAMANERLDQATHKITESELAVEQRLAKALIEMLESGLAQDETDGRLLLRGGQQDLAAFTGASLDSVKKIIRIFKDRGIVSTGRQTIIIREIAILRDIANGDRTANI
jgi:CRP/FNR family transcriptional regulator, cyclic AMP receptor protein